MTKLALIVTCALATLTSTGAFAGEKTVVLAVKNMYCAVCPQTVRASLRAVPGVTGVNVSYKDKTVVVIYDDSKIDLKALTAATTNAGYPSALKI
jgi:mercuric ion binding protein